VVVFNNTTQIMTDYSKMKCEDMRLFVFEWVILNPKAGKGIKYVRNLNKAELKKAILFIEGKLSKEVLMEEVIIPKKMYFSKTARIRLLKKKGEYDDEEEDTEANDEEDTEANDEEEDTEANDEEEDTEADDEEEDTEANDEEEDTDNNKE